MSFAVNHLIGFGARRAAGAANPSISYVGQNSQTGAATSHTFSAQGIGTAATGRRVVVGVSCFSSASGTLSSATIAGNAATIAVQATGTTTIAALIIAQVDSGTTGDIVLNWSSSNVNVAIQVYRILDLTSSTAHGTGTDNALSSGAFSLNCNVPANGVAVATAVSIDGSSWGSWSSGLTEDSDQFVASSNAAASASGTFVSAQTPYAASATAGTGSRGVAVMASWGN